MKIADDKLLHFSFSCILVIISSLFLNNLLLVMGFVFLIGLLKELWDEGFGSGFSKGDIIADGIGIIFGAIILVLQFLIK
jgi:hypothetical protein